ncbi:MAG: polysaccharide biosynthesis tyrosine autokinase [Paludibacteraceae bacterium]|nr:polysaccharide biosynthesis tyrosine autokinase [Paludibacteraceae bacterium]
MSQQSQNRNIQNNQEEEEINISDLLQLCLYNWKWFVLSIGLCMSVAILYLMSTSPIYTRTATLLILSDKKGKSATSMTNEFQDLGLFTNTTNINNELLTLKSPSLMTQVVNNLDLANKYVVKDGLKKTNLYKVSPVKVVLPDLDNVTDNISFKINVSKNNRTVSLSDFKLNADESEKTITGDLNDTLATPIGRVIVNETTYLCDDAEIYYSHSRLKSVTDGYCNSLTISLADKNSDVLNLSINDPSPARAEDILNSLIFNYNENWIQDRNELATKTSTFITERLQMILQDLTGIDKNIATFKGENLLPDIKAVSQIYLEQNSESVKQLLSLNGQLMTLKYINDVLSSKTFEEPLPSSSALSNGSIQQQVIKYNEKLLERNRLISNSSSNNPLVNESTETLKEMQKIILQSVKSEITALTMQIEQIKQQESNTISKLARNPNQAKYLLSEERQQKVMEGLYLFLLQKREENELSKAYDAYKSKIITEPRGADAPISPRRPIILLAAFVIGLAIPAAIFYILESMNTKVRTRKDLESMIVPFSGEIPMQPTGDTGKLAVQQDNRNLINESFRVLRSNTDFILGNDNKKVVMITSLNQGSGKSFISANLAACAALRDKKVIVLDLDLRRGTLSKIVDSPKLGLSDYFNGKVKNWRDVVATTEENHNLHVLPTGTMPPNPTELLLNKNYLSDMMTELRNEYDYIFVDCPPVDVVADAGIAAKYADMTIFVLRAGLMEKSHLHIVDEFYNEKKYPMMCVVLNGTNTDNYKYGYGYGYSYGYGYGYGKKENSYY